MSRHNRQTQHKQQQAGKKAQEREARILAARQRMRLHTFTAVLLDIFYQWRRNDKLKKDIICLTANERRYIAMQSAKIEKRLQAIVRMLGAEYPKNHGNAFFADASRKIQTVLAYVCQDSVSPVDATSYEIHCIMTYLFTAAVYEMNIATPDDRQPVQDFIRDGMAFANHIIPNNSRLLEPLNKAYWATREFLHDGAKLPVWKWELCPPGSAEYERRHGVAA